MTTTGWFAVDRDGLAQVLARRPKAFVLYELVQNAWDSRATRVDVRLEPVPGRPIVKIEVEDDDPRGFSDLQHAFTLYAPSEKKGDPGRRGFMNLGEKLVLALCDRAQVVTVDGSVIFDEEGRRRGRERREKGTLFRGYVRMTRDELAEVLEAATLLLPPIPTTVNGIAIPIPDPICVFGVASLPTTQADADGCMRRVVRSTEIALYRPLPDRPAYLYEMGIPVVELEGDAWSIDVGQRVPLNADRDAVPPSYLRALRVAVVNTTHALAAFDQVVATSPMALDALGSSAISSDAVRTIVHLREGDQCAVPTPADPESRYRAAAADYTLVEPRRYSAEQWEQIRRAEAIPSTADLFPTGKEPLGRILGPEEISSGMQQIAHFAAVVGAQVLGHPVVVRYEDDPTTNREACYGGMAADGGRVLIFNVAKLGRNFFDLGLTPTGPTPAILEFLIHEYAHDTAPAHLSMAYHEACCRIGAAMIRLALHQPNLFLRAENPVGYLGVKERVR